MAERPVSAKAKSSPGLLIAILSSIWIVPASCTMSAFVGTPLISSMNEVHYKVGDQEISPRFHVAVQPDKDGKPFKLVPLNRLATLKADRPELSTLMPTPSDFVSMEDGSESYRVIETPALGQQIIEVVNVGSSSNTTSRYKTTGTEIQPISFNSSDVGQMMTAVLVGSAFGVVLMLLGRSMRRSEEVAVPPDRPPIR